MSKKQIRKLYAWILICLCLTNFVMILVARYTIGIVSKNNVIASIDQNIASAESYLEKNENSASLLMKEFEDEYATKARTAAMFLEQCDADDYLEEQTLEELRVIEDAERISVADADGDIIASSNLSEEGDTLREEFQSHLSDNVYTKVLFLLEDDTPIVVAASSLGSQSCMIQIIFSADMLVSLLKDADLSGFADDIPLYPFGTTALLDAETLEYISCTDASLIGETVVYDENKFKKNKNCFDVITDEGKAMVKYQKSGDYIILITIPYSDIYQTRNTVIGWLIGCSIVCLCIMALTIRMVILQENKKIKNNP